MDHSYSQAYVRFNSPRSSNRGINVSIEYTTTGVDNREIALAVTPVLETGINMSDFAVAFAGTFAWGRVGAVAASQSGLVLEPHNLPAITLGCTAPAVQIAGVWPPGSLSGAACATAHDCASADCSCHDCSCHDCTTGPPGCGPADDGGGKGCGTCSHPRSLPHYAASLGNGTVGFATVTGPTVRPSLQKIMGSVAAKLRAAEAHDLRYGAPELTLALTSALAWRNVWTGGAEDGPVLPMTYGFSWITPMKHGYPGANDWRYVLFCWDNIFASYTAGVLGYKEIAYSNLIQIVKAKSRDGFVPNWAAVRSSL